MFNLTSQLTRRRMARLLNFLRKRSKTTYVLLCFFIAVIMHFFGVFTHLLELDFYEHFDYPMRGDIKEFVAELKNNQKPSVSPINSYNYSFVSNCQHKCIDIERLQLVYIVKSAPNHFKRREAIRYSWGFEGRFSDVSIRTVFILGIRGQDLQLQADIEAEQNKFKDIVQANFTDAYFNNTIKTMMGMKWAVNFCPKSKFYMFSDDDMYVSTKNVLRFLRNPTNYPKYMDDPVFSLKRKALSVRKDESEITSNRNLASRNLKQILDFELDDEVRLFTGFVFVSAPHRHYTSKWSVSLAEYPYHLWPPYVTAGAYILSREALLDMYYGSFFTQHFRFDDIYLALIAKKVDLEPYHCDEFHFYKKQYDVYSYRYVIASHGYSDPKELTRVWNEQKSAGSA